MGAGADLLAKRQAAREQREGFIQDQLYELQYSVAALDPDDLEEFARRMASMPAPSDVAKEFRRRAVTWLREAAKRRTGSAE